MTRLTIQKTVSRRLVKPVWITGNFVAILMSDANKQMYNYMLSHAGFIDESVLEIGFGGGMHLEKVYGQTNGERLIIGINS